LPTGQLIRPFRAGRGLIEDGRAFPTRCPGAGRVARRCRRRRAD